VPADAIGDILHMVCNELDVDLVRLPRREGGVEAVVSLVKPSSMHLT